MVTRTAGWFTVVLMLLGMAAFPAVARDRNTIVGTVTRVDQNSMEVTPSKGAAVSVTLDANTTYRKWIASKVWRLNADRSLLRVGRLVEVELNSRDPQVAAVVYIR